jgi:hypothetical protein
MPKNEIIDNREESILADPQFSKRLLETISQIKAGKNKWHTYEELVNKKLFLNSVVRGKADANNGKTHCTQEVKAALISHRNKEKK